MDALPLSVRRLRRALIAVSMLCAVLVLVIVAVLIYWRLYLLGPSSGAFARGPYLVSLSEDSASLAWSVRNGGGVELRAIAADGSQAQARNGSFTGLEPSTVYAWTAAVDGRAQASGSFTTAPQTLADPVAFAVIGDYGSGNDHEWAVGRVLAAGRPDFILTAGDNSYLAALPPLLDRNIFKPLAEAMKGAPLWATMGEHDLAWRGGEAVTSALRLPGSEGRYAIRYGPVQVVLLGLKADAGAIAFARRALAQPGPTVRFVVVHRPLQPGDAILPLLRQRGVAAVFAGHLHRYERRLVDGVLEFTVGTSGEGAGASEFTRASPDAAVSFLNYGLLRVTATATGVEYRFIDERGRVLDQTAGRLTGR
jgi:tartrate-resistant acid phosphatase type 5